MDYASRPQGSKTMHGFETATPTSETSPSTGPWWKELNRYHWFVLIVAALGWLFDTMDQQLFNLARVPAMRELLAPAPGVSPTQADIDFYGGISTSIFLLGWATGGLAFGIMGDRVGRAKTMLLTILLYSAFTGLSALSWDPWSFAFFRFLTGLGVGGEFAVGVALVAEVMPVRARPFALGLLQALSAVGNITAAIISLVLSDLEERGAVGSAWRIMFVIGAVPALLAILIRRRLKEPEQWQAVSGEQLKRQLGSYGELFGDRRWRKNAIVGLIMAASGVIGLWGIGFFSIDLNRSVFRKTFETELRTAGEADKDREFIQSIMRNPQLFKDAKSTPQPNQLLALAPGNKDVEAIYSELVKRIKGDGVLTVDAIVAATSTKDEDRKRRTEYLTVAENSANASTLEEHTTRITKRSKRLNSRLGFWAAITSVMLNIGAFFGIYAFTYVTHYVGRRAAFAVAFVLALLSTVMVFGYLTEFSQIFWMIPLMGFCQLALFGGYAIYFPELFPTHLRSTGTSFCYNVGRFVAASGPLALGYLSKYVFSGYLEPMRPAGVTMSAIFLLGLFALPFAPETKGKPLPE
jgi:MFS family permease